MHTNHPSPGVIRKTFEEVGEFGDGLGVGPRTIVFFCQGQQLVGTLPPHSPQEDPKEDYQEKEGPAAQKKQWGFPDIPSASAKDWCRLAGQRLH
jgi:hypothetical protein